MPSQFAEFRFLDGKHKSTDAPKVSFQAQKKIADGDWKGAMDKPAKSFTIKPGQVYSFTDANWGAVSWADDDGKRVVVRVLLEVNGVVKTDNGYIVMQDPTPTHHLEVFGASLFVVATASECRGFLLSGIRPGEVNNVGDEDHDKNLQFGVWKQGGREFLPK